MIPDWEPARAPQALRAWQEVLRPIAEELHGQAPTLATASQTRMQELVPDAFVEPTAVEAVRRNAQAGIDGIAVVLERGSDPTAAELPAGLLEGARLRAERGYALAPLMRGFRIAHAVLTEWLVAEIFKRGEDRELQEAALATGTAWVFACVDTLATAYAQAYDAARDAWLRSAAAVRSETLEAILDGTEGDVTRASARLGYELDRHHVGIVGWIRPGVEHAGGQELLQAAMTKIIARAGGEGSLIEPLGLSAARAWMGRRAAFDAAELDFQATALDSAAVSLAVGEPGAGIEGFCRTYIEAEHARRVASLGRGRPGVVTRYADVELLAIATIDLERTRAFVFRILGGLSNDDDLARRLAATLSIYLQENLSRTRTAKRLGIHENTVTYRIRQAQGILESSVESETLELGMALTLLPSVR